MLIEAKTLRTYKLHSLDGEIGKTKDFYLDDQHWVIRYMVVDTGDWLSGKKVLISPYALKNVIKDQEDIFIELTNKQIEDSPSPDSDKPVSRQFEDSYNRYYELPPYWAGAYMWGAYPTIEQNRDMWKESAENEKKWDSHLRSAHEVDGYHIHATDGEIGHVQDFIIDVQTWAIRYLLVDTKNWWPGKKVMIPPQAIERVSWSEGKVFVNLSRGTIKHSEKYIEESKSSQSYHPNQIEKYQVPPPYYDRKTYWI